jgi:hypothetical protein
MPLPARIKGCIKDARGEGIVGATAACGGVSAKTIAGGAYLLMVPADGVQTVTGSMAGRTSVSVTVAVTAGGTASAAPITLT